MYCDLCTGSWVILWYFMLWSSAQGGAQLNVFLDKLGLTYFVYYYTILMSRTVWRTVLECCTMLYNNKRHFHTHCKYFLALISKFPNVHTLYSDRTQICLNDYNLGRSNTSIPCCFFILNDFILLKKNYIKRTTR